MEDSSKRAVVQIGETEIQKIEYRDQQVVTFAMIDKVHGRVDGTAGRTFRENKTRFVDGEDFCILNQPDEIRRLGFTRPQGGTPATVVLVTRRGYLKVTKSLNDDRAWEVFDQMVERYFAVEQQRSVTAADLLANPHQLLAIAQGYALQIEDMKREITVMQKDVDVLDRISKADGLFGIREAAQILQMQERKFTEWLQRNGWCFRHTGNRALMAYADKRRAGWMTHKVEPYSKPDGTEGTRETLKFTPAGIAQLAKRLNVVLTDGDLFSKIGEDA